MLQFLTIFDNFRACEGAPVGNGKGIKCKYFTFLFSCHGNSDIKQEKWTISREDVSERGNFLHSVISSCAHNVPSFHKWLNTFIGDVIKCSLILLLLCIKWNLVWNRASNQVVLKHLQSLLFEAHQTKTRHVCTYLNAFFIVIWNKVMRFQNVDICYNFAKCWTCRLLTSVVCSRLPCSKCSVRGHLLSMGRGNVKLSWKQWTISRNWCML